MVQAAQSLTCTGLAMGRRRWRAFPVILHVLHKVLTWHCLLVFFRVIWSVTEGRGEPVQNMFSGTCSGTRQAAAQRQSGAVAFLAGIFAAFLGVSEQMPSSVDFFFFVLPLCLVHSFPKAACFKQEPDCTRGRGMFML